MSGINIHRKYQKPEAPAGTKTGQELPQQQVQGTAKRFSVKGLNELWGSGQKEDQEGEA